MVVGIKTIYSPMSVPETVQSLIDIAKPIVGRTQKDLVGLLEKETILDIQRGRGLIEGVHGMLPSRSLLSFAYFLVNPAQFREGDLQNGRVQFNDKSVHLKSGDLRFYPSMWLSGLNMPEDELKKIFFQGVTPETYGFFLEYGFDEQGSALIITFDNSGMEFRGGKEEKVRDWKTALKNFNDYFIAPHIPKNRTYQTKLFHQ